MKIFTYAILGVVMAAIVAVASGCSTDDFHPPVSPGASPATRAPLVRTSPTPAPIDPAVTTVAAWAEKYGILACNKLDSLDVIPMDQGVWYPGYEPQYEYDLAQALGLPPIPDPTLNDRWREALNQMLVSVQNDDTAGFVDGRAEFSAVYGALLAAQATQ